jgi:hypothetical protein
LFGVEKPSVAVRRAVVPGRFSVVRGEDEERIFVELKLFEFLRSYR